MPDFYNQPTYRAMERAYARLKIAGFMMLVAAVLTFVAFRFQTKDFLIQAGGSQHGSQHYDRLWFDVADDVLGASWEQDTLLVERWSGANPAAKWRFRLPGEDHKKLLWAMAGDSSHFAWVSGSKLHFRDTAEGSKTIDAKLKGNALTLTFLSDGSAAVVFDDLKVGRWNAAGPVDEWRAPIRKADRAAASGNTIAFSSIDDGKLTVFTRQDDQWIQVQQFLLPELPDRIVLPAPSVSGTTTDGRLRVGGVTRSGPGEIRSVAAHLYDVLASGNFEGIWVLPPEGEYYRLTDASPGSVVAAGERYFAVSGEGGTSLASFGLETRLTGIGRKSCGLALGISILAIALACAPLLMGIIAFTANTLLKPEVDHGIPNTLGKPPVDLVKACASGQMMLWAGAGLSAQSGFPLRAAFIDMLLEIASVEFAGGKLMKNMKALSAAGKGEAALNQFVAALADQRGAIISQFSAIFGRFAPISRAHEFLARLNLQSAVTANYDVLLEKTCDEWMDNVKHLGEDDLDGRFLLKLYGSLSEPRSVLLSRSEFVVAMDRPNVESVRQLFSSQPMFFVGCSIDGLLSDLTMMRMPEGAQTTRFAVAAVSGNWNKTAAELLRRYGIKVIACPVERIAKELPAFLQLLAGDVQRAMPERSISTNA